MFNAGGKIQYGGPQAVYDAMLDSSFGSLGISNLA